MSSDPHRGWDPATHVATSGLMAGGVGDVAPDVVAWVEEVSSLIRQRSLAERATMVLRAYRHLSIEHLSCDFLTQSGEPCHMMTFIAEGRTRLDLAETRVPDITEALHLAGLLSVSLQATTMIDCVPG